MLGTTAAGGGGATTLGANVGAGAATVVGGFITGVGVVAASGGTIGAAAAGGGGAARGGAIIDAGPGGVVPGRAVPPHEGAADSGADIADRDVDSGADIIAAIGSGPYIPPEPKGDTAGAVYSGSEADKDPPIPAGSLHIEEPYNEPTLCHIGDMESPIFLQISPPSPSKRAPIP